MIYVIVVIYWCFSSGDPLAIVGEVVLVIVVV